MGGRGGAGPRVGPEQQIQQAYRDIRRERGTDISWVGLAELRERLTNLTREQQDQALIGLIRARVIRLIPEENQKTITERDRRAAINLSGEFKHLIGIL